MAKKRPLKSTDDLPISETPIDTKPETIPWDPTGTNPVPETPAEDHNALVFDMPLQQQAQQPASPDNEDAELEEFLAAVRAVADTDTEIETPRSWSQP